METIILNMRYIIYDDNPKCINCNISGTVVPCIYQTNIICKNAFDLNKSNNINMTQEGKVSRYLSFIVDRYETCTELYRDINI